MGKPVAWVTEYRIHYPTLYSVICHFYMPQIREFFLNTNNFKIILKYLAKMDEHG